MRKPAALKKTRPRPDWHTADIQAALKKRGWTLRKLSISHGYEASAAAHALRFPWPRLQEIIARQIGMSPWDLWPSRYNPDGSPISGSRRLAS